MRIYKESICLRIEKEVKELLKNISKIEGKTMTEVLIEGIYEKAEKIKNKGVSA